MRDFIRISGRGRVHNAIVGGPKEVADRLEQWFAAAGLRRLRPLRHHRARRLRGFRRFVVPELQRRGLFRKDFAGTTLRENLGLQRPAAGAWKTRPRAAAE